jgi:TIR domain
MDYSIDVFISYRRQKWQDKWLATHFLQRFEFCLNEEIFARLRRPAVIFFDQSRIRRELRTGALQALDGIEPGSLWRTELEQAIKSSRCMVGLWSPTYFGSDWCTREWTSFADRPGGPLVSASVYDGKFFPPAAREFQLLDLSEYVSLGIDKTDRFSEFEQQVKLLAEAVAEKAANAPEFCDWPIATSGVPQTPHPIKLPSLTNVSE